MRICFSVSNLELGGAQMFVIRLAAELAEQKKHQVWIYDHWPEYRELFPLHGSRVVLCSYSENHAVRWMVWKLNALFKKLGFATAFRHKLNRRRFQAFLKKEQIEIINSHALFSDMVISQIDLPKECHYIPTLHGEYELLMHGAKQDDLQTIQLANRVRHCPLLIYTAEKNLDVPRRLFRDLPRAVRINVGINPATLPRTKVDRAEMQINPTDFVIGMVSRGIPDKNWQVAIQVIKNLNQRNGRRCRLILITEGSYVSNLVREAADDNIILLNLASQGQEYYRYYSLFDVLIFPSVFPAESMPNAVIEAMSWQVPVVSTLHAELPYMLGADTSDPCGYCIPVDDNLTDAFTTSLKHLRDHPEELKRLSANCLKAFNKFDLKMIAAQYSGLFDSITNSPVSR